MVDDSIEEEIENDDEEALRWSYSQKTDMWLSRPLISPSIQVNFIYSYTIIILVWLFI